MFGKFVGAGETEATKWSFTTTSAISHYQIRTFSDVNSTVPAFMAATTPENVTGITSVTPPDDHLRGRGYGTLSMSVFLSADVLKRRYVGFTVPEGKVHRIPQEILDPQLSSISLAYLMGDYVPME